MQPNAPCERCDRQCIPGDVATKSCSHSQCPIPSRVDRQAGPLMVRHIIGGHEVMLPSDARLNPPDDDLGGLYD